MPSKKKKYNTRFPASRIKKIMQTDEEIGKVAQAVPIIISRTLELFVESLLKQSVNITQSRNAKTLTPSHMKQCILSESRFDFLRDLVKNVPDASVQEDIENNALENEVPQIADTASSLTEVVGTAPPNRPATITVEPAATIITPLPYTHNPDFVVNYYTEQSDVLSSSYQPTSTEPAHHRSVITSTFEQQQKLNFSIENLSTSSSTTASIAERTTVPHQQPQLHLDFSNLASSSSGVTLPASSSGVVPPSLAQHYASAQSTSGDNLLIDEDYDN